MRKIKIDKWKSPTFNGGEADEDLLLAIHALVGAKKPEEIPRGITAFQIMNKIGKAFDDASSTGILVLEEREYKFLKDVIEKDVPSTWGLNKQLSQAINDFLNAKEE